MGAAPPVQTPSAHNSAPLQMLPSEQAVPSGAAGFEHSPLVESQVPARWQESLAEQITGVEPLHAPAWHESAFVQALPSSHAVPLAAVGFEQLPLAGSQVPATWHASLAVHTTGLEPVQTPPRHESVFVQPFPSVQLVPSAASGFEQVPVLGSHEPVV